MMKFIFGMQISIKVFYKLILSFSVCVTRHTQITQDKFAYFCNISRKALDLLAVDKHKMLLQGNSITLGVPKVPKTISLQYLKESMKHEVDFLPADKVNKGTSLTLRLSSKWYYHFRGMWPGMPKLPKITSLLRLYLCPLFFIFSPNDIPSKTMKNVFYFI